MTPSNSDKRTRDAPDIRTTITTTQPTALPDEKCETCGHLEAALCTDHGGRRVRLHWVGDERLCCPNGHYFTPALQPLSSEEDEAVEQARKWLRQWGALTATMPAYGDPLTSAFVAGFETGRALRAEAEAPQAVSGGLHLSDNINDAAHREAEARPQDDGRLAAIRARVEALAAWVATPNEGPDRPNNRLIKIANAERAVVAEASADVPYLLAELDRLRARTLAAVAAAALGDSRSNNAAARQPEAKVTTGLESDNTLLGRAATALIWMSGSADFGPDGQAGERFASTVRPLIDELLRAEPAVVDDKEQADV